MKHNLANFPTWVANPEILVWLKGFENDLYTYNDFDSKADELSKRKLIIDIYGDVAEEYLKRHPDKIEEWVKTHPKYQHLMKIIQEKGV